VRRRTITTWAALAALTVCGAALATGGGVVASANGGYSLAGQAAGSTFEIRPFAWNVQLHADGSAHGQFNYTQVRDGNPLTVKGSLTCAVVVDDHVWVGGVIEDSSRASLIGLDMWFQAEDNGEGTGAPPDMSSTVGAGPPGTAQQYCDNHPAVLFPFLVEDGNLQVRLVAGDR
jgi:hypothetical protein